MAVDVSPIRRLVDPHAVAREDPESAAQPGGARLLDPLAAQVSGSMVEATAAPGPLPGEGWLRGLAAVTNPDLRDRLQAELADTFADPAVWLEKPNPVFGGRKPVDAIAVGNGHKVLDRVLAIKYGAFS